MKTCTKCRQTKPLDDFHRFNAARDGRRAECKECACARTRSRYDVLLRPAHDTGPLRLVCGHCDQSFEYVKTTGRRRMYCSDECRYQAGQALKIARSQVDARRCGCGSTEVARMGKPVCGNCKKDRRDPEKSRAKERRRTLRRYGITEAEFDRVLSEQRGRCAICKADDPRGASKQWAIDHDHVSGHVRGLLCSPCNSAIGLLGDEPRTIRAAAAYVERHRQLRLVVA